MRPPVLDRRVSDHLLERWAVSLFAVFNNLSPFKSQAPLRTEDLAKVMIKTSLSLQGLHVLETKSILYGHALVKIAMLENLKKISFELKRK